MIITMLALALAAQPAADPKAVQSLQDFMSKQESPECKARLQDALAQLQSDPQVFRPGEKPELSAKREWRPGDHPEAGGYYAVNKMVNGCMVPVPMGEPKVIGKKPSVKQLDRTITTPAPAK